MILCKNQHMESYIRRLERVGVSAHEAYRIVFDFLKNFGIEELEEYICELEGEAYVGRV